MPWHLAQLNIALPMEPLDAPALADFLASLAPVNAIAEAAPGFVWRLRPEDGDATALCGLGDDRVVLSLSVWESVLSLADFVYGKQHLAVMRRKRQWFLPMREAYTVLWWVPAGHEVTLEEASEHLAMLDEFGPSPQAFTFRTAFPPPEREPGIAA